jgi:hypothetical protein
VPSNKPKQLTKLRAAPVLQAEVPSCAPADQSDEGTASQLIPRVRLASRRGPVRQQTTRIGGDKP